ncbi:PAS domain-containing protein [Methanococcoides sp. SA1]|nr:PAS domain-containing protein [Methanococcoides sp. SA1]
MNKKTSMKHIVNKQKPTNKQIQIILIFLFVVLAAALFSLLDNRKKYDEQEHLQLITERYELAYKTIYSQHKKLAVALYSGLLERYSIVPFYERLLTASATSKDILREELLVQILPRYEVLQNTAMIRQLHFHLVNNESFLRLHRPGKFGDNLTGIRETVEYVNREHSPIEGFEEGRIFNGYRFVFPITASDKKHLGSVEISFGPEAFTAAMMEQYKVLCNFFMKETVVDDSVFFEEIERGYKKSHHLGYYFDKNVLAELKKVSQKGMKELTPHQNITDEIYANAHGGRAMSLYDPSINMVLTTIPVMDTLRGEMVAFLTVRSMSPIFAELAYQFRVIFSLGLFLLATSLFIFYQQYSKRRIVEGTMALLQQERDRFMQGPVMTFTWENSENWPVKQVSDNVLDILGCHPEELLDGSILFSSLIHPDDLQRVTQEVTDNSTAENRSFVHEPYRLLHRNGTWVWILDNTILIRNRRGEISHYSGYLIDISNTILMQEELGEAKTNLELVIKSTRVGIWDWQIQSGETILNERWAEIIGYTLAELAPISISTWMKYIVAEDLPGSEKRLKAHWNGETDGYMYECRMKHKSGKIIWVLDTGQVVEWNEDGSPRRMVGTHIDITPYKEAEREILESQQKFKTVADFTYAWEYWVSRTGKLLYVSPSCERITGYTQQEFLNNNKLLTAIIHPDDQELFAGHTHKRDQLQEVVPIEFRIVTKDGQERWLGHVCREVFNDSGECTGRRGSNRDITLQKGAEQLLILAKNEAETANQAKSTFLANMSHELRTPLNAILGYCQIFARDSSLSSQQQSGIKTIHQSGEHLLLLINDILDLSKIEAGKMDLVESEFRLSEFLNGVVDIIRIRCIKKKIDFRYEPAKTLPVAINFDEVRLRQVLLNLLSNAVKFTNSQGMCIFRISSEMQASGKALLQFSVEDSGMGIPREMQEEVFTPFQQIGDRLQYSEGSGLGLSISCKLVQMMGSVLQLVSPVNTNPNNNTGPGSLFSFTVEAEVVRGIPDSVPVLQPVTGYSTEGKQQQKKILIVDDILSNREVLQDTLVPLGFILSSAENGSQVLAACEQSRPDLILMDLHMPKVDGFAALKILREHPRFVEIPVIALTAFANERQGLETRCLEYGFNGFLGKPYSVPELLETLAAHMRIKLRQVETTAQQSEAEDIVAPPEEVMVQLRELLTMGDLDGLIARASELAQESSTYQDFSKRIVQMAEEFQLTKLDMFLLIT